MGRVELAVGGLDAAGYDVELCLDAAIPGDEEALRTAFARALERATAAGDARRFALAPDAKGLGLPAQRCAEILIESARAAVAGGELEILFVLSGEPTYRIYEAVYDAARIAEQMRRLRG